MKTFSKDDIINLQRSLNEQIQSFNQNSKTKIDIQGSLVNIRNYMSKLTDRSNSNIKHRLTSSLVGLQPHRSRLEVKSENFEYV